MPPSSRATPASNIPLWERLKRDLYATCRNLADEHSNSIAAFFVGVFVSLLHDVILFRFAPIVVNVVINLVTWVVVVKTLDVRPFVEASRSAAARLSERALESLQKNATKAFLAWISKPLAAILKLVIKLRKAQTNGGRRHSVNDDVTPASGHMIFAAGFVSGRFVQVSILLVGFVRETRMYGFVCGSMAYLAEILISNFILFPVLYFILVSVLALVATIIFVFLY